MAGQGIQLPVSFQGNPLVLIAGGQLLHDVNGPVLTAGAPDGNGDVASVVPRQRGEPVAQKAVDVAQHLAHIGLLLQEFGNALIAACQRAQLGLVMGIGQHAHIEHEIRIARNATLEGE